MQAKHFDAPICDAQFAYPPNAVSPTSIAIPPGRLKGLCMSEQWLTVHEAAEISGYHPERIRELLRDGKISKARKYGPLWQVDRASLLAYVKEIEKIGRKRGPKTGS